MKNGAIKKPLIFILRFLVLAPILLVVWWYFLPVYASSLGFFCVLMLRYVFGLSVTGFHVNPSGILNTGTVLELVADDHQYPLPVAQLATNIAPFIALTLASFRKSDWRWIRHLGWGSVVLIFSHFVYLVVAFRFRDTISLYPDIPTIVAEIFLTLPFLLWVLGCISEKKS